MKSPAGKSRAGYTDVVLFKRLLTEARPYWRHIAATFVVSLLATPLTLLTPVPLMIAVDSVIGTHPVPGVLDALLPAAATSSQTALLAVLASMFVLIAVLTQVQITGTTVLQTYIGERLVLGLRSKLFQHIQRLSLAYHDRIGTADSTYRIQYDAMAVQYVAVQSAISFITAASTLAGMLYVTYRIDPQLALIALAVSPPILLIAKVFRPRMRGQSREVKKLESGALSVVQEVLTGLRVVKAFGQEDREHERFIGRAGEGMRARIRLAFVEGAYSLLIGATIGAGGAAVLFIGMRRVESGAITLGDLLLVMGYLAALYAPLKMMAKNAGNLQKNLASAERTFWILDQAPEVPERPHARSLARSSGAVEFCDVSFAYEPDRPVLSSVSFAVEPGERVGIAGPTGAGKSTLMNLLTRFYDPTSGRILVDGVDLRDYRLADLRSQFGIVLQEPVLFSTSLAENIAYARPDASAAEIVAAAKAANAHDFIAALPDGYHTQVGERGMTLSGGERQRISLARAFLKDAPVLVLDEPTSSVDTDTEAVIMEAMERLMAGRTSFMIAHRLSTLEVCDRRLEIDRGRVVEPSPKELPVTARPGRNGARSKAALIRLASAIARSGLEGHPAVKAWSRLHPGEPPRGIMVLRERRKSATFRLDGCGSREASVIAKRCRRSAAEIESTVYGAVLPGLPINSLRYHGTVEEDEDSCWIFVEDAGGGHYSPLDPEHRRLAALWLATLHRSAAESPEASRLPDRGPDHYLVHLRSARDAVFRQLSDRPPDREERRVLTTLLAQLQAVESRWDDVDSFCATLPRTLVHGDLSQGNLRLRAGAGGLDLLAYDWEKAGWGVPASDVAHLGSRDRLAAARFRESGEFTGFCMDPCLETYGSVVRDGLAPLDRESLELTACVGTLFRCIAAVDWRSRRFTPEWTPVTDLHLFSLWLSNAMEHAAWDGASRGSR
jgi:ATP-binding cassette subfamily B protein